MLKITLKKSLIGYEKSQGLTAKALGLGKVGSTVVQPDSSPIRGMIRKITHVLEVETVNAGQVESIKTRGGQGQRGTKK